MRFGAGCEFRTIFGTFLAVLIAIIYTGRMNSEKESSFCPLETGVIIHTLPKVSVSKFKNYNTISISAD